MSAPGFLEPAFQLQAGTLACHSLLIGGGTLVLAGGLLWTARRYRPAVWLLLALTLVELFTFARQSLDRFNVADVVNPKTGQFLSMYPGDYRVLDVDRENSGLSTRTPDIWGYDPGNTPLRYAQLIAASQGADPDQALFFSSFNREHPLLGLFRCRFMFFSPEGRLLARPLTNSLPHLLLVTQYRVLRQRNEIISALTNETFNPRAEVILESAPNPPPQAAEQPGTAAIIASDSDHLTIEAELKTPAVLVVTDNYARGWRVQALPGSSQQHYEIMPANYAQRGVPLAAGHHRLQMEYRPTGFVAGQWVSEIALILFAVVTALYWYRRFFFYCQGRKV